MEMPLIKVGWKCILDTYTIQEWAVSSVSFNTVSKILPVCHLVRRDILLSTYGMFHWLLGWYCSYLLPRQALATYMEKHNQTLRQIGRPAPYKLGHSFFLAFLHCHNYVNTFIVYDRKPFGRNVTVKESPFRWHPLQSISDERSSFGRNNVSRWLFWWTNHHFWPLSVYWPL